MELKQGVFILIFCVKTESLHVLGRQWLHSNLIQCSLLSLFLFGSHLCTMRSCMVSLPTHEVFFQSPKFAPLGICFHGIDAAKGVQIDHWFVSNWTPFMWAIRSYLKLKLEYSSFSVAHLDWCLERRSMKSLTPISHSTKVFADKPLQQQAKYPVFSGAIIF